MDNSPAIKHVTLRDVLAGVAMVVIAAKTVSQPEISFDQAANISWSAYLLADLMLKERTKLLETK